MSIGVKFEMTPKLRPVDYALEDIAAGLKRIDNRSGLKRSIRRQVERMERERTRKENDSNGK